MRIARSGRFVFVAQWVAAVVLPVFFFLGRGLVGAELGWMAILGIVYGLAVVALLLVPPLLTLFDREGRRARATRFAYDIATFVMWGAILLASLTVPDAGDSGHVDSAFMNWFGLSYEASEAVFATAAGIIGLAYLATFVLAIAGIVRGRAGAPVDAPARGA
ncbi:hypothetical protein [Microbacterium timonense]|uniref:hypothetical protein n=1 Tax=Microbacterium timonense TaxID=2086576 RepID=UPI000D0F9EC0|nr:hypothetical protein [Microbacterium timonense]